MHSKLPSNRHGTMGLPVVLLLKALLATLGVALVAVVLSSLVGPPLLAWQEQHMVDTHARDDIAVALAVANLDLAHADDIPPLGTRFTLDGDSITHEQLAFMRYHGFIHFDRVLNAREVSTMLTERQRIERDLLARNVTAVFGVPLFRGADMAGNPRACVARIPFTSTMSHAVRDIIRHPRFEVVKDLVADAFGITAGILWQMPDLDLHST